MPPTPVPPWRLKVLALIFGVIGLPMSVFLIVNARSGFELAYRAITGVVLLVIAASLAWRAWRPK
jgi:hypothetical protein